MVRYWPSINSMPVKPLSVIGQLLDSKRSISTWSVVNHPSIIPMMVKPLFVIGQLLDSKRSISAWSVVDHPLFHYSHDGETVVRYWPISIVQLFVNYWPSVGP